MVIDEIFPHPSVKQVVFQIRYPNLFIIENKIGEIQISIMREFPESKLSYRRTVMFADIPSGMDVDDIPRKIDESLTGKVWEFISPRKYKLSITSNSLSITSELHKTYNRGEGEKFRDIIEFVISNFLRVINISKINRMGLRYIDECPIFEKNNENFRRYYNSVLPLDTYSLEDSEVLSFRTVTKKGDYNLIYMEELININEEDKLMLSFDAYAIEVNPANYLEVLDALHEIDEEEYDNRITEEFKEYMRREK